MFTGVMEEKRPGLLTEMVPGVALIAIMLNPTNPQTEASAKEIQSMPRTRAAVSRRVIPFEQLQS